MTLDMAVQPALVEPALVSRAGNGRWLRVLAGLVVLGLLIRQFGSGPFVDGLRATSGWTLLVAIAVTAATTACCALRWSLISARFGERVPMRTAYAAYYRSQAVNALLPGGVVGDVHRGLRYGLRSVVAERFAGQGVQLALTGLVLLPSPYRWIGPAALLALAAVAAARGAFVVLLSAGSVLGHLLIFLVAAQAAGATLSPAALVPVGALVLLGSAIPLNVAGWGPREGVAAWAFATFGSTASAGLTVSVTFGVLAGVATLPGLLLLGVRDD